MVEVLQLEDVNQYTPDDVLLSLPLSLRKMVTIISSEEHVDPHLYHISSDSAIKTFTPMMSRRTMMNEDRRVARVSCSTNLMGALTGYASLVDDTYGTIGSRDFIEYTLYGIPFDYCVKPKQSLPPDVNHSDERWLVHYSDETEYYPTTAVAKFYVSSMSFTGASKSEVILTIMLTAHKNRESVVLSNDNIADPQHDVVKLTVRARKQSISLGDTKLALYVYTLVDQSKATTRQYSHGLSMMRTFENKYDIYAW